MSLPAPSFTGDVGTILLKLACRACHGVVLQHAAPERLIRGGLPTERLVAHVIDAKYHQHLPLYRQAQMLATHGIALDRSTLAFWVGYAAQELKPLQHRLRELLLASSKLCVDETPAPVLDPGRGRTKTGYFWALSRDDRPWAGPDPPGVRIPMKSPGCTDMKSPGDSETMSPTFPI